MAQTVSVHCDNCGTDISETVKTVEYRLVLSPEVRPTTGGGSGDGNIDPLPIPDMMFFCTVQCLATKSAALAAAQE